MLHRDTEVNSGYKCMELKLMKCRHKNIDSCPSTMVMVMAIEC